MIIASLIALTGCQKNETESGGTSSGTIAGTNTSSSSSTSSSLSTNATGAPGSSSYSSSTSSKSEAPDQTATTEKTGDAAITQKVRSALRTGPNAAQDTNVRVSTTNGKVTLRGSVSSQAEKDRIENEVKALQGVQSVDNQLRAGTTTESNAQTTETNPKP